MPIGERASAPAPDPATGAEARHVRPRAPIYSALQAYGRSDDPVICVIHAHPYPSRSRTNRALAAALRGSPGVDFRALYELYPDFDIDVVAEQKALERVRLVVWMHPVFWYSMPALLKHWIDKVLAYGWAYGEGGTALHGKHCLWVPTTGGDEPDFASSGIHGHPFATYVPAMEQTARFCGMRWEPPCVVHDAIAIDDERLARHVAALTDRLVPWRPHRSPAGAGAAS